MPKKIILIRHAETEHTLKGIIQGWLDVPLNKAGLKQAEKLAHRLKDEAVDVIYSSDLKRAYQTAKPLAKIKQLKPIRTKKIREWHMGTWTGKTWKVINKEYSHVFDEVGNIKDLTWKGHQGESINELIKRLKSFLNHLFKKHRNQTVVIFTHAGTKRRILDLLKVLPMKEGRRFENTAVTILKKIGKGKYAIQLLGDISHLEE
ncbi:histidine phosphatase family protein [Patescibacteria group bacterium]|nr:histidine phosphatase family protein [Patescibacteria group bacterium]